MDVSLNSIWTNSLDIIKSKIPTELNPIQKKVAIFAAVYIALVVTGFFLYGCYKLFRAKPCVTEKDNGKKNVTEPVLVDDEALLETESVKKTAPAPRDIKEIPIKNADLLRTLVNQFHSETIAPGARQWRILLVDNEGQIQGIRGPDGPPVYVDESMKANPFINIHIDFKKTNWYPSQEPAFDWNSDPSLSPALKQIIDATLLEANELAKGAHRIASKNPDPAANWGTQWLAIFEDVNTYDSATLLNDQVELVPVASVASPTPVVSPSEADDMEIEKGIDSAPIIVAADVAAASASSVPEVKKKEPLLSA